MNFYACAVTLIDSPPDWSADLMDPSWSSRKALEKLASLSGTMICDTLLDQHIIAGARNIFNKEQAC